MIPETSLEYIDEMNEGVLDKMRYSGLKADEARVLFEDSVDVIKRFFETRGTYLTEYKER